MRQDDSFNGNDRPVLRARAAAVVLTLTAAVLIGRIAHLQFSDPHRYTRLAATARRSVGPPKTRRGDIYDRRGRLLATSSPRWSVFADPPRIRSSLDTARILARILDVDVTRVYTQLSRTDRRFVWIRRQVSRSRAEWVRAMELSGIHLRREDERFYPFGGLFAHVVGYADVDGRGLKGAEFAFDDMLSGQAGAEESAGGPPERGYDVYLTVDAYIQAVTNKALMRQVERHEPESAWALVLDVESGEVLSMVNWPQFDPADPAASPYSVRRNRILNDTYEYGSVNKPFTVAVALENGLVEADTEFDCHQGVWRFGNRRIHDVREHGTLTVSDILTYSSNIGVAQIGLKLGTERFWWGLRQFGFGESSGIELPWESTGIMRSPERWNEHSLISIAFGQEVSVNAAALARAYMALAGDGMLIQPYIMGKITDSLSGEVVYSRESRRELRRAVSSETARKVVDMMERVVKEGTGTRAAVEHYRVAGKTGTGTLMCEEGEGYSADRYISTFVGFAPVEDPEIVVLVSLKVPTRGGYYGGSVAGPAFREITKNTLGYLNVQPTTPTNFIARAEKDVYCE